MKFFVHKGPMDHVNKHEHETMTPGLEFLSFAQQTKKSTREIEIGNRNKEMGTDLDDSSREVTVGHYRGRLQSTQ